MKKRVNFESFSSKKFDSKQMNSITGGVDPTYGRPYKTTSYCAGVSDDGCERITYNPQGYQPGCQGRDAC